MDSEKRSDRPDSPADPLQDTGQEPPPFLGRWRRIYVAVLCYLSLLIVALYIFTLWFRY